MGSGVRRVVMSIGTIAALAMTGAACVGNGDDADDGIAADDTVMSNVRRHVARSDDRPRGELAACLPAGGSESARNYACKFAWPDTAEPREITWTCYWVERHEDGGVSEQPGSRKRGDPSEDDELGALGVC